MPREHWACLFYIKGGGEFTFLIPYSGKSPTFLDHTPAIMVFMDVPKISLFGNSDPADLIKQIAFKVDFWINMLLPWWIFKGELCWQVCTATNSLQTRLFCQIDLIDVIGGSQNTTVWPDALWWSQMHNIPPLSPKFYTCDMTHHTLELDWDYLAKGLLINL